VQPRDWALASVSLVTVCRPCGCQLLFVRDDLLSGDYGTALARLMKFPEVADPTVLLDKAAELRDREYRPPTYLPGRRARSHAIRQGLTAPRRRCVVQASTSGSGAPAIACSAWLRRRGC